jgi:RHS repeat-associated protein
MYWTAYAKNIVIPSTSTLNITSNTLINWAILNYWTIRASYWASPELYLVWNIINNWYITPFSGYSLSFKVNGNIQNSWIWNNPNNYLKWDPIAWASSYFITVRSVTWTTVSTNQFLMPLSTLTWSNITWYASWNWTTTDAKCINVSGCILTNWETNPTAPSVINFSTPYVYNSNSISSLNMNSSLYLTDYTNHQIKSDNNEQLANTSEDTSKWDPVRLNTWEFDYDNTLISYNSEWMPFDFKIKYKNKAYYNWPMWNNFDFNYNIYLSQDGSWNINFHDWKLWAFKFTKTSSWFTYNDTINANLIQSWSIYTINFDTQRSYKFWSNFKIDTVKDNYWNEIKFTYNDNKELIKIKDTLWREYLVSYYSNSRFKDITDFAWNKVEFIYFWTWDTLGSQYDLKTIKMTNSWAIREIWFTYTTWSTFESAHNMVKLIDSENNTYVENIYDSQDRVSEQKYWNDKIYYDYYMDSWNNYIEKNIVTDRVGNVITYFYDNKENTVKKLIHKNSWDLEYNYVYDSKSNLIKEIKPLWNWVEYSYDINNNIIETRIKADMSASWSSNDIVSTATYDLTFNKPTQIVSSEWLTTNFTYDTNWNLLTKVVLWVKDYENNNLTISWSYLYNSGWQLIKEINAKWLETTFEYSSWNLVKIKKWTWTTAIENNFQYDLKWNIVKSIDALGKETLLTYDDFNLVVQKLSPESIKTNYSYNKLNKITNEKIILWSWSGAEDFSTDYEYDILDNISKVIQDLDSSKKLTINNSYDDNGRLLETQAWSGVSIKYLYDQNGLIIEKKSETWPLNWDIVTTYTYDNNERLITQKNPRGKEINYEYDLFDRVIKKILPDGTYEKYYYDKENNIIKKETKDEDNNLLAKEENTYDKRNKVISNSKYVLSSSWSTQTTYVKYDEVWNTIKTIDPKGNEVNYSYDIFNRIIETQDSLWNKIQNIYDKNNNIIEKKIIQSNSKTITTTYSYDDDNRLILETNTLDKTKAYEYNNLWQVIKITDEEGNITNYTYNYDWKLLTETKHVSSENLITEYEYDERWNMIKLTDAKGNITNYEYDNLSRLVKQIYPDSTEVNYTYDKNSNIKTKTDPNWTVITNTYDDLDRIISKSIVNWSWVEWITSENFTYDKLGRLVWANDSNNHNLSFDYDSLNRLLEENQSWSIVNYTYDNNNNLLSITNPNNKVTSYTYDDINRLTQIKQDLDTIATYNYTWIENTSIDLWNGTSITKTYDELSRLSSLNNWIKSYDYNYDDVWNILSDNYKNYNYDEIYRLTQVNKTWSWNINLETLSYDKAGNRVNNFNALIWSGANYEYITNNLNQYVTLSWSVDKYIIEEIIEEIEWWWSWSGETNYWSWETSSWSGETETWSWEMSEENFWTGEYISWSWETNSWSWENNEENSSWSWSESWSWETISWSGETETWSWENNEENSWSWDSESYSWSETSSWEETSFNEWLRFATWGGSWSTITSYSWWFINVDDSTTYTYDNNWNIINNWKYKFIYDYKNRIVEVTNEEDETIVQYEYDVLDRRYKKETPNKLVEYIFSNENILEENITESWNTVIKDYINWLWTDDLIAYDIDSTRYYFNNNNLGSIDWISDDSWTTLISYEYDSYWNVYVESSGSLISIDDYSWSTFENERLYTGREYDSEINLHYLRARYYDSKIGRFISRDPIDIADDVNLYSYVGNNSINYNDPEWKFANFVIWWASSLALWLWIATFEYYTTWEWNYSWKDAWVDVVSWAVWVWIFNKIEKLWKLWYAVANIWLWVAWEYIKSDCPKWTITPENISKNVAQYVVTWTLWHVWWKFFEKSSKYLNTNIINFSQTSINKEKYLNILEKMKNWYNLGAIDVVRNINWVLVSIDNKRLAAAKELWMDKISAIIHDFWEKLSQENMDRFKTATTWWEALLERTKKQTKPKIWIDWTSEFPKY